MMLIFKKHRKSSLNGEDFLKAYHQVVGFNHSEPAFKLNANKDPITLYLADLYTVATSCAGLPGLSIPNGFINDLPIGVQLIAPHFLKPNYYKLAINSKLLRIGTSKHQILKDNIMNYESYWY